MQGCAFSEDLKGKFQSTGILTERTFVEENRKIQYTECQFKNFLPPEYQMELPHLFCIILKVISYEQSINHFLKHKLFMALFVDTKILITILLIVQNLLCFQTPFLLCSIFPLRFAGHRF